MLENCCATVPFMEIVNEIGELSQNLLDELGMTPQMFTEMAAATDTNVNAEQLPADIQVPERQRSTDGSRCCAGADDFRCKR